MFSSPNGVAMFSPPATNTRPVSYTLRQLIALNEEDPEAYEVDEMLDDLPLDVSDDTGDAGGDEADDGGFGGAFE